MSEEFEPIEIEYDFFIPEEEPVEYAVRPNKTRIKQEIAAMFELGEKISGLTLAQIQSLDLPEQIQKGVIQAADMPPKGARKRLLKYIAGQLYKIDAAPIIEKIARFEHKSAHAVREHHIAERWRDRLLKEGNDALTELIDDYPDADRQHLRQLLRNAQKESATGKPPRSARQLYKYLKSLIIGDAEEFIEADDVLDDDEEEQIE